MPRNRVIHDEGDVRQAVRDVYGDDAMWIEAARGGTQGAHDVVLHRGPMTVSAELKAWDRTKAGTVLARLRPAQVRLHHVAGRNGWASIILFGVIGESGLWVIHSREAPRSVRSLVPAGFGTWLPDLRGEAVLEADARAFQSVLEAVAGVTTQGTRPNEPKGAGDPS